jgi:hypothetical protein
MHLHTRRILEKVSRRNRMGVSDKPVYIAIVDGEAELRDASAL